MSRIASYHHSGDSGLGVQANRYPSFESEKIIIMSPKILPGPKGMKLRMLSGRLLSFLVYELNEFFAEALVSAGNLEDMGVAFFGQSFFRKRRLHL